MSKFGKVKGALFGIFKRGHPDVYDVLKKYCDERGLNVSDVTASAVATWMAGDEEGQKELEEAMKKRRTGGGKGGGSSGFNVAPFKEMCEAMGTMFTAMNAARAGMSMASMLADFTAVSNTLTEIKKAGSEGGEGSMDNLLATVLIKKFLPDFGKKGGVKKQTGTGKVKKVE
ncbi:hypothetical protein ES705_48306 [subsurface metagenome]